MINDENKIEKYASIGLIFLVKSTIALIQPLYLTRFIIIMKNIIKL